MSSTARNRRAKDPDRVRFNRGRLVILAAVLLLAGATTLTTRLLQNQTASALVIIALLVVAVPAVGRALQVQGQDLRLVQVQFQRERAQQLLGLAPRGARVRVEDARNATTDRVAFADMV